ncbi:hypothetical protein I4F81_004788 [Pyropia yezoensis]|uniref:Uncharacterized protein n=1 Tax=Pyropia yezoensis TaxID=2788 RepID=A0ACC3BX72_PYRYE|nr:hypothetical protein I4F81_004788 [Neopyropia yezoensis]
MSPASADRSSTQKKEEREVHQNGGARSQTGQEEQGRIPDGESSRGPTAALAPAAAAVAAATSGTVAGQINEPAMPRRLDLDG